MVEKLLCFGAGRWPAPQAKALFDRAIDQIFFRSRIENLIEFLVRRLFINLLQPQIAFQSLSPDWPLLHAQ